MRTGSGVLLNLAALVVIMAGLRAAETVVVPILVAVFLAVISFPLVDWLCSRRVPLVIAVTIVLMTAVLMLGGLGLVVSQSVQSFTDNLPGYESKLTAQVSSLRDWLRDTGFDGPLPSAGEIVDTSSILSATGKLVTGLGLLLTNTVLILLCYVFLLLEANSLPMRLRKAFGGGSSTIRDLSLMAAKMKHYLALKALLSIGTGVPVWLFLWVMGVDYPVLWGLLAFLLNFIPNIGSVIAAVPPSLLALVQFGPVTALVVAGFFILVNTVLGNIVEPRVMGEGLGLSTFIVFVALVFWGWALGTVGMFLAVPLTIMVQIVLASGHQTRRFAILLGGDLDKDPDLREADIPQVAEATEPKPSSGA
ncbi:MAG: AI-2E family transporter [Bryobacterales bacterium]|nr:AI-2E family transporter [Bryobacterales bacterium]